MNINTLIALSNPLDVSLKSSDAEVSAIVQDSRQVKPGYAFIAIRGHEVDGHLFIDDAIHRGASVIICEESFYTDKPDVCVIEVEHTRAIAGVLAQAFAGNPAEKLSVIGITGTNGKTTTATLVYQILRHAGKNASLLGTVSKRILDQEIESNLTTSGPVELAADMKAMVDAGSDYLVMEVSSHALHQRRVAGIDFEVAAFTNLSHDHLDYHRTVEDYAKAKKILFDELPETATAVINMDDPRGSFMASDTQASVLPFSFKKGPHHIISNTPQGLTLAIDGRHIQSPLVGTFNAYNVAQAVKICEALGLFPDAIAKAVSVSKGAPGRMENITAGDDKLPVVIVDYAHTPDALENVLSTLKQIKNPNQQLTVIFGAGGDRDPMKRPEMAKAAEQHADQVVVTSDNPRFEDPDAIIDDIFKGFDHADKVSRITNRLDAIQETIAKAESNHIILIAGKGHEDYQDVKGIKYPFDDREIAREALKLKDEGGA